MTAQILIVEDTPHNLQLMTYLLDARGHTVTAAETAEDGLALARADPPDLILMDLQLPGMDGYQALTALRATQQLRTAPVVAVTSFAMIDDKRQAIRAGFNHYLTKPIDPESFGDDIDAVLPAHLKGCVPVACTETGGNPSPRSAGGPDATSPPRQPRACILVLDDNYTNRHLLESVLIPHGYEVISVSSRQEAMRAVVHRMPDLFLCDVHLDGELGTEMLEDLHRVPALAAIPFAFVTATADRLESLLRHESVRVIRRPVEPAQLLAEVAALLNRSTGD